MSKTRNISFEDFYKTNGWRATFYPKTKMFYVLERGMSVIIAYPKSDKFKEGKPVRYGLEERIKKREK